MYDELKSKCETFKTELESVAAECEEGGRIKDVRAGSLYDAIQRAANGVANIISTIDAYYSEQ